MQKNTKGLKIVYNDIIFNYVNCSESNKFDFSELLGQEKKLKSHFIVFQVCEFHSCKWISL